MPSERNNTLTTLMILDDTNNTNDIKIPENEKKNKVKCVCIETHCLPQVFNGVFQDTSSHCEHGIVYLTNLSLGVAQL